MLNSSKTAILVFFLGAFSLTTCATDEIKNLPAPFAAQKITRHIPKITVKKITKSKASGTAALSYAITCGDNILRFHPDSLLQSLSTGGSPTPIVSISYWGSTKTGGYGFPFKGTLPKTNHDKINNSITISKKFHASSNKNPDGLFTEKITVEKDGLIDFNYSYKIQGKAPRIDHGLFFTFRPYKVIAGMKLLINGKPYQISQDGPPFGNRVVFDGKASEIVFFPDQPTKSFCLIFPKPAGMYIREKKKEKDRGNRWKYFVEMRVHPAKNGSINFKLDMRNTSNESIKTGNTFNGINFWKNDRINIPNFATSKNLLINPSFESGLRYYDNFFTWGAWPGKDYKIYTIDDQNAKFGNRCLRISAWKAYPKANYLTTFTTPTIPDKKYTFSFYAKTEGPNQRLDFTCVTAEWGKFPKWTGFNLSESWKRYSVTFTAPNNAAIVMIKVRNLSKKKRVDTLVDGLQLEQNGKVTEYADRPFGSELITSNPDNFITPDKKINAKMRIATLPDLSGRIKYTVKDFFYNKVCIGKSGFTSDSQGNAIIDLPFDGKIGTGVFVLQADYALSNGKNYTDFYRFSRMQPLTEDYKHRKLFACGEGARTCRSEAMLKRLRNLGFGSNNYQTSEKENSLYAKYNILNTGSGVINYGPNASANHKKIRERVKEEAYSDELRDAVEKFSYDMAKANPWVKTWFLQGECNAGGGKLKVLRNRDNTSFVKFILACAAGIKRADPSKKLMLTGGPANMSKMGGIRDIDIWLGLIAKIQPGMKFDSISIHPYRAVPENPDLDDDTATLLQVVKKHGYQKAPIYWNEGIYNTPWNIPEWGLDPHKGCSTDHWRAGTPTYDMGWGERISAAYFARSWLVALKYGDRIKQYNGWAGSVMAIDTQMSPLALQKIPNTLGHLLGNSVFKKDIRFAPDMRAYVFLDGKQRPVAALWSYLPMVDRGFEPSPVATMKFTEKLPEFIDLMGNHIIVKANKDGEMIIPVTPFPLFIRSKTGTLEQLCSTLKNAKLIGSKEFALQVGMRLKSKTSADISFTNQLSRPFTGEVQIAAQQRINKKINLPERASTSVTVKLANPVPDNKIAHISLLLKLTEKDGNCVNKNLSIWAMTAAKSRTPIIIDGNLNDWKNIPAVRLNNRKLFSKLASNGVKDFDAEYKVTWNADYLYLCVNVIDDKPFFPALKSVGGDWTKDSLQVYIDTYGDNANRRTKSIFDVNDYNYDISMTAASGKVNVFRRAAPEQQLAGGVDAPKPNTVEHEIKTVIKKTSKGYIYEIAFPRHLIAPLLLEKQSFFRLGLIVNDNDGNGRECGLSNLPLKGSAPFENPDQWPGLLLTE